MDIAILATQHTTTRDTIRRVVSTNCHTHVCSSADQLLAHLNHTACDCLFIGLAELEALALALPHAADQRALMGHLLALRPALAVVIIAANRDIRQVVQYMKSGASNYIMEPVNADEIRLVLEEIHRERHQQSELAYLREQVWQDDTLDIVHTHSATMRRVFDNVLSVAATKTTVLLLGETGTGKSFTAKLIHRHSNRKRGPFISVHCGAIPETLIESELFGHEKGAFTGAHRRKPGKFELAGGGTIFLDEIGTISKSAQVKLLTVLQEGLFQRVGGEQSLSANVRVIAASNVDLKQMCDDGGFRKDLYYRLNVFPITIPQLCDRKEDIPLFASAFLERFNQFNTKMIKGIQPVVMQALLNYHWPGNIRELENLLERAYILEATSQLTPESFPSELFEAVDLSAEIAIDTFQTLATARKKGLADIERRYLREVLSRNRGKITASAREAGIGTRQLNKLMRKYRLDKRTFKAGPSDTTD